MIYLFTEYGESFTLIYNTLYFKMYGHLTNNKIFLTILDFFYEFRRLAIF